MSNLDYSYGQSQHTGPPSIQNIGAERNTNGYNRQGMNSLQPLLCVVPYFCSCSGIVHSSIFLRWTISIADENDIITEALYGKKNSSVNDIASSERRAKTHYIGENPAISPMNDQIPNYIFSDVYYPNSDYDKQDPVDMASNYMDYMEHPQLTHLPDPQYAMNRSYANTPYSSDPLNSYPRQSSHNDNEFSGNLNDSMSSILSSGGGGNGYYKENQVPPTRVPPSPKLTPYRQYPQSPHPSQPQSLSQATQGKYSLPPPLAHTSANDAYPHVTPSGQSNVANYNYLAMSPNAVTPTATYSQAQPHSTPNYRQSGAFHPITGTLTQPNFDTVTESGSVGLTVHQLPPQHKPLESVLHVYARPLRQIFDAFASAHVGARTKTTLEENIGKSMSKAEFFRVFKAFGLLSQESGPGAHNKDISPMSDNSARPSAWNSSAKHGSNHSLLLHKSDVDAVFLEAQRQTKQKTLSLVQFVDCFSRLCIKLLSFPGLHTLFPSNGDKVDAVFSRLHLLNTSELSQKLRDATFLSGAPSNATNTRGAVHSLERKSSHTSVLSSSSIGRLNAHRSGLALPTSATANGGPLSNTQANVPNLNYMTSPTGTRSHINSLNNIPVSGNGVSNGSGRKLSSVSIRSSSHPISAAAEAVLSPTPQFGRYNMNLTNLEERERIALIANAGSEHRYRARSNSRVSDLSILPMMQTHPLPRSASNALNSSYAPENMDSDGYAGSSVSNIGRGNTESAHPLFDLLDMVQPMEQSHMELPPPAYNNHSSHPSIGQETGYARRDPMQTSIVSTYTNHSNSTANDANATTVRRNSIGTGPYRVPTPQRSERLTSIGVGLTPLWHRFERERKEEEEAKEVQEQAMLNLSIDTTVTNASEAGGSSAKSNTSLSSLTGAHSPSVQSPRSPKSPKSVRSSSSSSSTYQNGTHQRESSAAVGGGAHKTTDNSSNSPAASKRKGANSSAGTTTTATRQSASAQHASVSTTVSSASATSASAADESVEKRSNATESRVQSSRNYSSSSTPTAIVAASTEADQKSELEVEFPPELWAPLKTGVEVSYAPSYSTLSEILAFIYKEEQLLENEKRILSRQSKKHTINNPIAQRVSKLLESQVHPMNQGSYSALVTYLQLAYEAFESLRTKYPDLSDRFFYDFARRLDYLNYYHTRTITFISNEDSGGDEDTGYNSSIGNKEEQDMLFAVLEEFSRNGGFALPPLDKQSDPSTGGNTLRYLGATILQQSNSIPSPTSYKTSPTRSIGFATTITRNFDTISSYASGQSPQSLQKANVLASNAALDVEGYSLRHALVPGNQAKDLYRAAQTNSPEFVVSSKAQHAAGARPRFMNATSKDPIISAALVGEAEIWMDIPAAAVQDDATTTIEGEATGPLGAGDDTIQASGNVDQGINSKIGIGEGNEQEKSMGVNATAGGRKTQAQLVEPQPRGGYAKRHAGAGGNGSNSQPVDIFAVVNGISPMPNQESTNSSHNTKLTSTGTSGQSETASKNHSNSVEIPRLVVQSKGNTNRFLPRGPAIQSLQDENKQIAAVKSEKDAIVIPLSPPLSRFIQEEVRKVHGTQAVHVDDSCAPQLPLNTVPYEAVLVGDSNSVPVSAPLSPQMLTQHATSFMDKLLAVEEFKPSPQGPLIEETYDRYGNLISTSSPAKTVKRRPWQNVKTNTTFESLKTHYSPIRNRRPRSPNRNKYVGEEYSLHIPRRAQPPSQQYDAHTTEHIGPREGIPGSHPSGSIQLVRSQAIDFNLSKRYENGVQKPF